MANVDNRRDVRNFRISKLITFILGSMVYTGILFLILSLTRYFCHPDYRLLIGASALVGTHLGWGASCSIKMVYSHHRNRQGKQNGK
jgi:hypothetical protein